MHFIVSFSRGDKMIEFLQKYLLPLLHTMERPRTWGAFHALFFFIGIPLAILLAFALRKISQKTEKRLFLTVRIALIISEIFKQLAFTAIEGTYRFDLIPFQLCSIPMYLCILMPMLSDGKIQRAMRTFIATFGLMGGVASYIAPGTMCREWLELTLHSFLWHLVLIFFGFYVFFSHNTKIQKYDFLGAEILYLSLCAIALGINFLCFNTSGEPVNMFYIGPKPSDLPVCREITARFGVAVNSIGYISALSLCAYLIHLAEKLFKQ